MAEIQEMGNIDIEAQRDISTEENHDVEEAGKLKRMEKEEIELIEVGTDIEAQRISTEENNGSTKLTGEDVAVPVELHNFVKKTLDDLQGEPFDNRDVTIFRVPSWFHEINKELNEPKMIAIGPYHHGKESLRTLEEHKWYTLRDFLARNENVGFEVYLKEMRSIEEQARNCYSESVDLESNKFVLMLLLDGCFILEWFSRYETLDSIFDVGWAVGPRLFSDMCLLENQIPLFVIHNGLDIQDQNMDGRLNCKDHCPLLELFNNILKNFDQIKKPPHKSCNGIDHLLHLYYTRVVPDFQMTMQAQSEKSNSDDDALMGKEQMDTASSESSELSMLDIIIPCASELHDAGINFKRKENPTSMLDISFKNGTIEMPRFVIDTTTMRTLWNMVAFEQSRVPRELPQILSSYLALMDSLLDTEKDVALLKQSDILDNLFQNAEEAATFFNQFGKCFVLDYSDHYFYGFYKDVKEYSESTWHKYRARLMQDYFNNPWTIISVVAAGILLVLTILQTYFSAAS